MASLTRWTGRCYGQINMARTPVDKGVAILTQSSNISINLTMQKRALRDCLYGDLREHGTDQSGRRSHPP